MNECILNCFNFKFNHQVSVIELSVNTTKILKVLSSKPSIKILLYYSTTNFSQQNYRNAFSHWSQKNHEIRNYFMIKSLTPAWLSWMD